MRPLVLLFVFLLSACGGSSSQGALPALPSAPLETGPFKALLYTRTTGFRHNSIEVGTAALKSIGSANGFTVDSTEDPTAFSAANLAPYRVVIFMNTTLTVLDTPAQRQALQDFVARGGGYVGIHAAADTEHDWPWYGSLVGAYFKSHPPQQVGRFRIEAADHPSVAHLANPYTIFDEFYSFKTNPRGTVRVLMNIDEASYQPNPNTSCLADSPTFPNGVSGVMGDHPMSWCHDRLGGRAWYTALGHEAALYQLPDFRTHVLQGILTAAKRVAADCTPREATPAALPAEAPRMCPVL